MRQQTGTESFSFSWHQSTRNSSFPLVNVIHGMRRRKLGIAYIHFTISVKSFSTRKNLLSLPLGNSESQPVRRCCFLNTTMFMSPWVFGKFKFSLTSFLVVEGDTNIDDLSLNIYYLVQWVELCSLPQPLIRYVHISKRWYLWMWP